MLCILAKWRRSLEELACLLALYLGVRAMPLRR